VRTKTRIPVFLLALLLAACATRARMEENLDTWVGRDADSLSAEFGYPVDTLTAPNGNKVYVYERRTSYMTPPTYQTYGEGKDKLIVETEGQTVESWCKIFFETDERSQIVRWRLEGNACRQ
jgi:hypothetical protein